MMRAELKKTAIIYVQALIVAIAVAFFTAFADSASFGKTSRSDSGALRRSPGTPSKDELSRIVRVLESRLHGRLLPEKANEKLATLSPPQIRLLDSLAARMLRSDDTAAADLAFFLITALIVSS